MLVKGCEARIRLSAYVHVSAGEPGTAAGTCREQEIDLVIGSAQVILVLTGLSVKSEERGEPRFVERLP